SRRRGRSQRPPCVSSRISGGAAASRSARESHCNRDGPSRGHRGAADSERRDRSGRDRARAAHYIDRELGGALSSFRQAYTAGLAALDRYARASRGAAFTQLSKVDQDSLLIDVETGTATGFTGSSAQFFALLLNHTHQGTFGDPYYGGNANFVGWDLIGYPGVRTNVTAADQQRMEQHDLKPNHKSAYDYESFTKASEDHKHGD